MCKIAFNGDLPTLAFSASVWERFSNNVRQSFTNKVITAVSKHRSYDIFVRVPEQSSWVEALYIKRLRGI